MRFVWDVRIRWGELRSLSLAFPEQISRRPFATLVAAYDAVDDLFVPFAQELSNAKLDWDDEI